MGWPVALLRLPVRARDGDTTPVSSDVLTVEIGSLEENDVSTALDTVRGQAGRIACVIYAVAPQGQLAATPPAATSVRTPFLLAKHAARDLNAAAAAGWAGFLTVARLDGELGLTGELPGGVDGLSLAGLPGLSKTLRLEWPQVACRAVDLAPDLPVDVAARLLVGEVLDPDRRITEVGWSERGRVTIEAVSPVQASGSVGRRDGV